MDLKYFTIYRALAVTLIVIQLFTLTSTESYSGRTCSEIFGSWSYQCVDRAVCRQAGFDMKVSCGENGKGVCCPLNSKRNVKYCGIRRGIRDAEHRKNSGFKDPTEQERTILKHNRKMNNKHLRAKPYGRGPYRLKNWKVGPRKKNIGNFKARKTPYELARNQDSSLLKSMKNIEESISVLGYNLTSKIEHLNKQFIKEFLGILKNKEKMVITPEKQQIDSNLKYPLSYPATIIPTTLPHPLPFPAHPVYYQSQFHGFDGNQFKRYDYSRNNKLYDNLASNDGFQNINFLPWYTYAINRHPGIKPMYRNSKNPSYSYYRLEELPVQEPVPYYRKFNNRECVIPLCSYYSQHRYAPKYAFPRPLIIPQNYVYRYRREIKTKQAKILYKYEGKDSTVVPQDRREQISYGFFTELNSKKTENISDSTILLKGNEKVLHKVDVDTKDSNTTIPVMTFSTNKNLLNEIYKEKLPPISVERRKDSRLKLQNFKTQTNNVNKVWRNNSENAKNNNSSAEEYKGKNIVRDRRQPLNWDSEEPKMENVQPEENEDETLYRIHFPYNVYYKKKGDTTTENEDETLYRIHFPYKDNDYKEKGDTTAGHKETLHDIDVGEMHYRMKAHGSNRNEEESNPTTRVIPNPECSRYKCNKPENEEDGDMYGDTGKFEGDKDSEESLDYGDYYRNKKKCCGTGSTKSFKSKKTTKSPSNTRKPYMSNKASETSDVTKTAESKTRTESISNESEKPSEDNISTVKTSPDKQGGMSGKSVENVTLTTIISTGRFEKSSDGGKSTPESKQAISNGTIASEKSTNEGELTSELKPAASSNTDTSFKITTDVNGAIQNDKSTDKTETTKPTSDIEHRKKKYPGTKNVTLGSGISTDGSTSNSKVKSKDSTGTATSLDTTHTTIGNKSTAVVETSTHRTESTNESTDATPSNAISANSSENSTDVGESKTKSMKVASNNNTSLDTMKTTLEPTEMIESDKTTDKVESTSQSNQTSSSNIVTSLDTTTETTSSDRNYKITDKTETTKTNSAENREQNIPGSQNITLDEGNSTDGSELKKEKKIKTLPVTGLDNTIENRKTTTGEKATGGTDSVVAKKKETTFSISSTGSSEKSTVGTESITTSNDISSSSSSITVDSEKSTDRTESITANKDANPSSSGSTSYSKKPTAEVISKAGSNLGISIYISTNSYTSDTTTVITETIDSDKITTAGKSKSKSKPPASSNIARDLISTTGKIEINGRDKSTDESETDILSSNKGLDKSSPISKRGSNTEATTGFEHRKKNSQGSQHVIFSTDISIEDSEFNSKLISESSTDITTRLDATDTTVENRKMAVVETSRDDTELNTGSKESTHSKGTSEKSTKGNKSTIRSNLRTPSSNILTDGTESIIVSKIETISSRISTDGFEISTIGTESTSTASKVASHSSSISSVGSEKTSSRIESAIWSKVGTPTSNILTSRTEWAIGSKLTTKSSKLSTVAFKESTAESQLGTSIDISTSSDITDTNTEITETTETDKLISKVQSKPAALSDTATGLETIAGIYERKRTDKSTAETEATILSSNKDLENSSPFPKRSTNAETPSGFGHRKKNSQESQHVTLSTNISTEVFKSNSDLKHEAESGSATGLDIRDTTVENTKTSAHKKSTDITQSTIEGKNTNPVSSSTGGLEVSTKITQSITGSKDSSLSNSILTGGFEKSININESTTGNRYVSISGTITTSSQNSTDDGELRKAQNLGTPNNNTTHSDTTQTTLAINEKTENDKTTREIASTIESEPTALNDFVTRFVTTTRKIGIIRSNKSTDDSGSTILSTKRDFDKPPQSSESNTNTEITPELERRKQKLPELRNVTYVSSISTAGSESNDELKSKTTNNIVTILGITDTTVQNRKMPGDDISNVRTESTIGIEESTPRIVLIGSSKISTGGINSIIGNKAGTPSSSSSTSGSKKSTTVTQSTIVSKVETASSIILTGGSEKSTDGSKSNIGSKVETSFSGMSAVGSERTLGVIQSTVGSKVGTPANSISSSSSEKSTAGTELTFGSKVGDPLSSSSTGSSEKSRSRNESTFESKVGTPSISISIGDSEKSTSGSKLTFGSKVGDPLSRSSSGSSKKSKSRNESTFESKVRTPSISISISGSEISTGESESTNVRKVATPFSSILTGGSKESPYGGESKIKSKQRATVYTSTHLDTHKITPATIETIENDKFISRGESIRKNTASSSDIVPSLETAGATSALTQNYTNVTLNSKLYTVTMKSTIFSHTDSNNTENFLQKEWEPYLKENNHRIKKESLLFLDVPLTTNKYSANDKQDYTNILLTEITERKLISRDNVTKNLNNETNSSPSNISPLYSEGISEALNNSTNTVSLEPLNNADYSFPAKESSLPEILGTLKQNSVQNTKINNQTEARKLDTTREYFFETNGNAAVTHIPSDTEGYMNSARVRTQEQKVSEKPLDSETTLKVESEAFDEMYTKNLALEYIQKKYLHSGVKPPYKIVKEKTESNFVTTERENLDKVKSQNSVFGASEKVHDIIETTDPVFETKPQSFKEAYGASANVSADFDPYLLSSETLDSTSESSRKTIFSDLTYDTSELTTTKESDDKVTFNSSLLYRYITSISYKDGNEKDINSSHSDIHVRINAVSMMPIVNFTFERDISESGIGNTSTVESILRSNDEYIFLNSQEMNNFEFNTTHTLDRKIEISDEYNKEEKSLENVTTGSQQSSMLTEKITKVKVNANTTYVNSENKTQTYYFHDKGTLSITDTYNGFTESPENIDKGISIEGYSEVGNNILHQTNIVQFDETSTKIDDSDEKQMKGTSEYDILSSLSQSSSQETDVLQHLTSLKNKNNSSLDRFNNLGEFEHISQKNDSFQIGKEKLDSSTKLNDLVENSDVINFETRSEMPSNEIYTKEKSLMYDYTTTKRTELDETNTTLKQDDNYSSAKDENLLTFENESLETFSILDGEVKESFKVNEDVYAKEQTQPREDAFRDIDQAQNSADKSNEIMSKPLTERNNNEMMETTKFNKVYLYRNKSNTVYTNEPAENTEKVKQLNSSEAVNYFHTVNDFSVHNVEEANVSIQNTTNTISTEEVMHSSDTLTEHFSTNIITPKSNSRPEILNGRNKYTGEHFTTADHHDIKNSMYNSFPSDENNIMPPERENFNSTPQRNEQPTSNISFTSSANTNSSRENIRTGSFKENLISSVTAEEYYSPIESTETKMEKEGKYTNTTLSATSGMLERAEQSPFSTSVEDVTLVNGINTEDGWSSKSPVYHSGIQTNTEYSTHASTTNKEDNTYSSMYNSFSSDEDNIMPSVRENSNSAPQRNGQTTSDIIFSSSENANFSHENIRTGSFKEYLFSSVITEERYSPTVSNETKTEEEGRYTNTISSATTEMLEGAEQFPFSMLFNNFTPLNGTNSEDDWSSKSSVYHREIQTSTEYSTHASTTNKEDNTYSSMYNSFPRDEDNIMPSIRKKLNSTHQRNGQTTSDIIFYSPAYVNFSSENIRTGSLRGNFLSSLIAEKHYSPTLSTENKTDKEGRYVNTTLSVTPEMLERAEQFPFSTLIEGFTSGNRTESESDWLPKSPVYYREMQTDTKYSETSIITDSYEKTEILNKPSNSADLLPDTETDTELFFPEDIEYSRTIGGRLEYSPWPWMVSIYRLSDMSFVCAGTLIDYRHVLSAAHCFTDEKNNTQFVVSVGKLLKITKPSEGYLVDKVFVHEGFEIRCYCNDVAVLRLADELGPEHNPTCLPYYDTAVVGDSCTILGWGDTFFKGKGTWRLQRVDNLPIVSSRECRENISRLTGQEMSLTFEKHFLCAGLLDGSKDACMGDSGGPLLRQDYEGTWTQIGIVSLGYKCGEPGAPGMYTNVPYFMPWIIKIIES